MAAVMQLTKCSLDLVTGPLHVLLQAGVKSGCMFSEPGEIILAAWIPEVPCMFTTRVYSATFTGSRTLQIPAQACSLQCL